MRKIKMGKMDTVFGTLVMDDAGQFSFEGDSDGFMRRWMEQIQRRGLSGEAALTAFFRDFSSGTYWFEDVP